MNPQQMLLYGTKLLVNVVCCMHEQVQLPSQNIVYKYKWLMFRFLMAGSMSWPFLTISIVNNFTIDTSLLNHHLNVIFICKSYKFAHYLWFKFWEFNQVSGYNLLTTTHWSIKYFFSPLNSFYKTEHKFETYSQQPRERSVNKEQW